MFKKWIVEMIARFLLWMMSGGEEVLMKRTVAIAIALYFLVAVGVVAITIKILIHPTPIKI